MNPVRLDLYTPTHKGLRERMFQTLSIAGSLDWTDSDAVTGLGNRLRELFLVLHSHHMQENNKVHPLLDSKIAGGSRDLVREHNEQTEILNDLENHFERIRSVEYGGEDRLRVGLEFYRSLLKFVAGYLPHMQREEAAVMSALWPLCSDEELAQVMAAVINSLSAEEFLLFQEKTLPALTPQERGGLFIGIKRVAPSRYDEMAAIAEKSLGQPAWSETQQRLKAA